MSEKVRLQESLHQPSELAKSIGAIFLPADWRGWSYSHYTQLEMIDQLLRPALSAAKQQGRDEQREKDAKAVCEPCRRFDDYHPAMNTGENIWEHTRIGYENDWREWCRAAAIRSNL